MSRIPTPETIEAAPAKSQDVLNAVKAQLGVVPNMFRLLATSPTTLEGFVALNGAMGKGSLSAATRERLALAIAEINGCEYCLAAHTYLGQNLAKLTEAEVIANRKGGSTDAKADAAVRFAVKVAQARGQVSAQDVADVKAAGYSDAEIVEITVNVALNTLTNYVNSVFDTAIDFPAAKSLAA
jgi:uncharacterized peroxidase-related enzyme